ncbi:hypothetical protein U14_01445 [Candidatus Moduliflexus flocculans]|uniref:Uncharacterized protein n=1 Tax=Candidatus Moduliflexus flocculans TaxID=1499966 RepID=A0A0S6VS40_9BACT|nr:hypothetical protein U14_01445 [Candidatus Moduliflexus flocculans]
MSNSQDYEKQRRNAYGESPHASRKNIPRNKRRRNRALRRTNKHLIGQACDDDFNAIAMLSKRKYRFRKYPDRPLGEVFVRDVICEYLAGRYSSDTFLRKVERLRRNYRGFHRALQDTLSWRWNRLTEEQLEVLSTYTKYDNE